MKWVAVGIGLGVAVGVRDGKGVRVEMTTIGLTNEDSGCMAGAASSRGGELHAAIVIVERIINPIKPGVVECLACESGFRCIMRTLVIILQ